MSLHIVEQATKLIEMLEGEETDVLLNEYSYGRYAYDVAKKFLEQDGEIEWLVGELRKIANYDVEQEKGWVDEWNEAAAFNDCKEIALQVIERMKAQ